MPSMFSVTPESIQKQTFWHYFDLLENMKYPRENVDYAEIQKVLDCASGDERISVQAFVALVVNAYALPPR